MPLTRPTRRWLLVVALALAAAAAIAVALRPASITADAAEVDSGPVRVTVDWTGKTRIRDRFVVAAPVPGELARPALRAGDRVGAGAVVARIAGAVAPPLDPRTRSELLARRGAARAAQLQADAAQQRAAAAADQARRDVDRAEALARDGALAPQALDAARTEARLRDDERRMAVAALAQARAEAAAADAALGGGAPGGGPVEVRAPVAGAVLRVLHESAGPVATGTPILELGDPADLEVVLDLPTADAVRVHEGDRATVSGWGGGAALSAVVRRIEPSGYTKVSPLGVEEQRVNVLLDPVGAGWGALGDGFSVDAQIVVEDLPDAVRVPTSSLFRDREGWALYAVEDGRARRRDVEVAARGGGTAAIREGVRPGDRVVVHPGEDVRDGVRVTLR